MGSSVNVRADAAAARTRNRAHAWPLVTLPDGMGRVPKGLQ